ncbi:metaxin-1 [Latimeria chalumnae]|uniref:Metaxin n=1 Tax=Latimeria chalumnae TaxID=7897 RepID=H3ADR3_LATCH|nr:PREDICTED: metaxin-1 [Latimeria chalumnae]|eukprot:XP_006009133.1 PREDICTED: metaxin-1 [Latimeria chalumnae]
MATPLELYCWKGDWGLPSVNIDCLTVLTYARFAGAPLRVHKIANPWKSPTGSLPILKSKDGAVAQPHKIITYLRKQKYNADYDLSAMQGADTLAFVSLLEEQLLPAVIFTFWIDSKNYVEHTRKWYAEAIPFPLNFFLPNRMQRQYLERLKLNRGNCWPDSDEEVEKELYKQAQECMTLLSQRLGTRNFFFGDSPASLDAFVFSHLALLLKARLPNSKLQQHLKSLDNLCNYCNNILTLYYPGDATTVGCSPPISSKPSQGEATDFDDEPHKRRNQIISVLVGLIAMIGYAFMSGIVSIQKQSAQNSINSRAQLEEEEEEE